MAEKTRKTQKINIEKRLERWGRWCVKGGLGLSGYASNTNIERYKNNGGLVAVASGPKTEPVDEQSILIEKIVGRLRNNRHDLAEVLVCRYVQQDSFTVIANSLRVSERTAKDYLARGKMWVEGALVNVN